MLQRRNIFIHGLGLTLRRLPAFLWTYIFNLGLALFFSIHLYRQFSALLGHSLAAQRLVGGFDLTTVIESVLRLTDAPAAGAATATTGVPLYLLLYFLLIPGTLFCYLTKTPARLSTLLLQGLLHFWRFVRITILTLLVSALILGPLLALQGVWSAYVHEHVVGSHAFFLRVAGLILLFLIASLLRLYFDLVEVYTVQLGLHIRSNGKPDRRVRRALGPAWRTFRSNFSQAWPIFLFLTILGAAAVIITARISMHMLAQPRVWPMFLLAQFGLFLMLFTRFWQRGAETSLALQYPIVSRSLPGILPIAGITNPIYPRHPVNPVPHPPVRIEPIYNIDPLSPVYPAPSFTPPAQVLPESTPTPDPIPATVPDPIPDPEPASPSLDQPDPGIFHHDPVKPPD